MQNPRSNTNPSPAAIAASVDFYRPSESTDRDRDFIRCDACGHYRPCRRAQAEGDAVVLLCGECAGR